MKELVAKASNDANRDPQIGRTLFDLLVPVEMEPFLGGTSEMVIELETGTAALPWEVLDTVSSELSGGDPRPWAIRSKLLGSSAPGSSAPRSSDADADASILVIGEPMVDQTKYPPLPGARAEAIAVASRLTSGPAGVDAARVRALTSGNDDARNIINALFERPYRVIHVAGHGAPGADGGVVLSGGTYLGAAEVKAMRAGPRARLPQLLPSRRARCEDGARALRPRRVRGDDLRGADRGRRALRHRRRLGGRGPAGQDLRATFYDALLGGSRFIDAVAAARTAAWRSGNGGNTWSAYQCYGDPGWTWQRDVGDAQRQSAAPSDEFAGVSSRRRSLRALETISIRLRFGGEDRERREAPRPGAARQDPLPRGEVRVALGQHGCGGGSVRPRLC